MNITENYPKYAISGRMELHPCVLQVIGPLGPLPKKDENQKRDEMRGSAPRQTYCPHGGDVFMCWICAVLPFFFCNKFFSHFLFVALLHRRCVSFFLPLIVCRFECVYRLFLSNRVRDAVPRSCGPDIKEISSYL